MRLAASKVTAATALILALCVAAFEAFFQGAIGSATTIAATTLALLAILFFTARNSQMFRYAAVSVLMAQIVALLIATRGHPFQIDMHMAFFAALAISALMYDIRAIILGATLVAVHHLGLGLLFPNLVFYGEGNLARVALHATILIGEAAGLVWMTWNTLNLLSFAEGKSGEAASQAEMVKQQRLTYEQDRSRMMSELQTAFGDVVAATVEGDFSKRVTTEFPDSELKALARGLNRLVETVDAGLSETRTVLSAIARADLSKRVRGSYAGAFAALKDDTNKVADQLLEMVGKLRTTSGALKTATSDILAGANDLSDRTSRQAATIEETSAAMEELANKVMRNADRAADAAASTNEVTAAAEESGAVIVDATSAMERVHASYANISGIIGMIDEIAFQTNLLALNASVEAARAGEAGRGFAVVAEEVRRLAQSSTDASAQVKALIRQSTGEVETGSRLVSGAADKLNAVLEALRANNKAMSGMAADNREQASAIEEVRTAMRQLDEMTQHNAALAEQTNAAIEQTQGQAADLDRIVDVFVIEKSVSAGPEKSEKARLKRAATAR